MQIDKSEIENNLEEPKGFLVKTVSLPNCKSNNDGTVSITKEITFKLDGSLKENREDYYPSESELNDINQERALILWKQEQLYIFTMLGADLQVDRQYEHFLTKGLHEAAAVLKGKPWLFEPHKWESSNEIGRILDAWVEDDSRLMLKVYILNNNFNYKILENIFAGIHSGVSIGFTSQFGDMQCDSCASMGKSVSIFDDNRCPHQPGTYDESGKVTTVAIAGVLDGFEVSGAPIPAQRPSAILHKSLSNEVLDTQIGDIPMSVDVAKSLEEPIAETIEEVVPSVEEEVPAPEEVAVPAVEPAEEVVTEPEVETPAEVVAEDAKPALDPEVVISEKSVEPAIEDNQEPIATIKSESSIIKDSKSMTEGLDIEQADGTSSLDANIDHNPMADKKLPLWTVELKSTLSEMNDTLQVIKSGMEGLALFASESKAVLSRFTTPEDGSDPDYEVRTVKQQEVADAQAKVLEGLVEKTLNILETISTDGLKEVKPSQNEWARTLTKKFVSGGNI